MTLRNRMIIWIWGTIAILLCIVTYLNFEYNKAQEIKDLKEMATIITGYYEKTFEEEFSKASIIPHMIAKQLENSHFGSREEITRYLEQIVRDNDFIYGSAVAFEPFAFSQDTDLFAPYCFRKDGEIHTIHLDSEEYNYPETDWYKKTGEIGKPRWTKPYFDRGGGDIVMITYSVPFFRNEKLAGVATVDLSVDQIAEQLREIESNYNGYGIIANEDGDILSSPFPEIKNINDFDNNLALKMKSGKSGFIYLINPITGKPCWVVHYPISINDFAIAIIFPEDKVLEQVYILREKNITMISITMIALLIVIFLLSESITRPFASLTKAIKRVADGNLEEKISVDTVTYEAKILELSFNKMMDDLNGNIENLRIMTAEKERMESEFQIARQIQMSVLPCKYPAFPERKEIEILGRSIPAKEVGGDFFDYFFIDENHLAFMVGDASGKGIPAAMFMLAARAFTKATVLRGLDPAQCLEYVNKVICSEEYMNLFLTLFLGVLDTRTGLVIYSNAGHNPPFYEIANKLETLSNFCGPALGIDEDAEYKKFEFTLERRIILYSDGVTEAMNTKQEEYSTEKFCSQIESNMKTTVVDLVNAIFRDVEDFAGDEPQSDDITLLILEHIKTIEA